MRVREAEPTDFKDNIKDSGCHAITFHDLRHTAASLMVQAGVSLRAVQQILGHCSVVVTERYAHLAPGFQASEAERLHFDLTRGQVVPLAVAR
jgi:site-specific recombinase XerD